MELASRFRDHDLCDAYISVRLKDCASDRSESSSEDAELDKFPAHLVVLTQSPYFQSQVSFDRQQKQQSGRDSSLNEDEPNFGVPAAATRASKRQRVESSPGNPTPQIERASVAHQLSNTSNALDGKPTLVLSIRHKDDQPAALAVIASLYGIKDVLSSLQPVQLVHAVRYADMLQIEAAIGMAVDLLKPLAAAAGGLGQDALAELAALPSWPQLMLSLLPHIAQLAITSSSDQAAAATEAAAACISAAVSASAASNINGLVQQILLATLGHLEAVWRRKELSSLLLQLPLPAMVLLISSSELSVYSEDTVLYTVEKYLREQKGNQSEMRNKLSELVRAPYLSDLQLSAQTYDSTHPFCPTSKAPLLEKHRQLLQQLQMLRRLEMSSGNLQKVISSRATYIIREAPRSWMQGPRRLPHESHEGVSVVWHLLVGDLREACINAKDSRKCVKLISPEVTPPVGGFEWSLEVQCLWKPFANGVEICVYRRPLGMPPGLYHGINYLYEGPNGIKLGKGSSSVADHRGMGFADFFHLGAMTSGWDEHAWAAKGLPTEGSIPLKLTVYKVW